MKKRFLIPIAFLMVTTLSAQLSASSSCADVYHLFPHGFQIVELGQL
jgi:hypothetical protein